MRISVECVAKDRKNGMTLDELASFVQEAMRLNIPGDFSVHVKTGMRYQITELKVPRT